MKNRVVEEPDYV